MISKPVRREELTPKSAKTLSKCHFCPERLDEGAFCHGCKVYVCDACDVTCGTLPTGSHEPKDHRVDPDDEGDDVQEDNKEGEEEE